MNKFEKYVALTFDDGPNTDTTPLVIEKLRKYKITASFFLVGDNINEKSAPVSKEAFSIGCEICSHSKTHSNMTLLTDDEILAEMEYTSAEIQKITGTMPRFFRPPYIAVGENMFRCIDLPFIAGIGAEDWLDTVSSEERADRILSNVKDGDIILLHDMAGNFPTVEALDIIIPKMQELGFGFLTVSGLFKKKQVEPKHGIVYSNVLQTEMF